LLIFAAGGSADGEFGVVVVGGHTVGAHSSDQVEVGEALADVVDQLLVDRAGWGGGGKWDNWGNIDQAALSLNEYVPGDALTGQCVNVVCGVGGAHIAGLADEEESFFTDTS
jgi:hypothetical protein